MRVLLLAYDNHFDREQLLLEYDRLNGRAHGEHLGRQQLDLDRHIQHGRG